MRIAGQIRQGQPEFGEERLEFLVNVNANLAVSMLGQLDHLAASTEQSLQFIGGKLDVRVRKGEAEIEPVVNRLRTIDGNTQFERRFTQARQILVNVQFYLSRQAPGPFSE